MMDISTWTTFVSIFFGLSLMGAMWANLENVFRKEKEDNIIFNAISWTPRKALAMVNIEPTYFKVALMSFVLGIFLIVINGLFIVAIG